jgi:hypothetical protein
MKNDLYENTCPPLVFSPDDTFVYSGCTATLAGDVDEAVSPVDTNRQYNADLDEQGGGCGATVHTTGDGGNNWQDAAPLPGVLPYDQGPNGGYTIGSEGIVPDPRVRDTVYANLSDCDFQLTSDVARSANAGQRWSLLPVPKGLQTFTVATDPHEPGLIVGRTEDDGVPADRVYLSSDHGQTWKSALCPGVLQGKCPQSTVDNVFGAGRSYALFKSGVYAFKGAGAAGARLTLSNRLPAPRTEGDTMISGSHKGDPVYFLPSNAHGVDHTELYRSDDSGVSWKATSTTLIAKVVRASLKK